MRSLIFTALSGAALLGFSAPAMAHPNDGDDEHEEQHQQLDEQHGDVHDQVGAIHDEAHEQGLSWYQHQHLHRDLDRAHANAHGNLEAQHYYQHQNDQLGYGGYGGYGNGYSNGYPRFNNGYYGYGAPQRYYGSNGYTGYNRGDSYRRYGRVSHHRYNPYLGY